MNNNSIEEYKKIVERIEEIQKSILEYKKGNTIINYSLLVRELSYLRNRQKCFKKEIRDLYKNNKKGVIDEDKRYSDF